MPVKRLIGSYVENYSSHKIEGYSEFDYVSSTTYLFWRCKYCKRERSALYYYKCDKGVVNYKQREFNFIE